MYNFWQKFWLCLECQRFSNCPSKTRNWTRRGLCQTFENHWYCVFMLLQFGPCLISPIGLIGLVDDRRFVVFPTCFLPILRALWPHGQMMETFGHTPCTAADPYLGLQCLVLQFSLTGGLTECTYVLLLILTAGTRSCCSGSYVFDDRNSKILCSNRISWLWCLNT